MEINKLTLINFKGIKRGVLASDKISIDFTGLPDGIIAIKGVTGAGKTTIMDNMHPFSVMPFRSSQNIVDSVDGVGEKIIEWTYANKLFKSCFTIDSKSRSIEALLYEMGDDGSWRSVTTGRIEEYRNKITEIFMNEDLFFTYGYRAQNALSFSAYKKSDFKKLFEQLLGFEYLIQKQEKAKKERVSVQSQLDIKIKELEVLQQSVISIVVEHPDKKIIQELLNKKNSLALNVASAKATLKEKEVLYTAKKTEIKNIEDKVKIVKDSFEKQLSNHKRTLETLSSKIAKYQDIIHSSNVEELSAAPGLLQKVEEEIQEQQKKIVERNEIIETQRKPKEKTINTIEKRISSLNSEIETLKKQIALLDEVPCSEEEKNNCKLLKNAFETRKKIPILQSELEEQIAEKKSLELALSEIDTILQQEFPAVVSQELFQQQKQYSEQKNKLNELHTAQSNLLGVQEEFSNLSVLVNTDTEEHQKQVDFFTNEKNTKSRELEELSEDKEIADAELSEYETEYNTVNSEYEKMINAETFAKEQEEKAEKIRQQIKIVSGEKNKLEKDLTQWRIIEKALGRDGILACELEIAAPAVSDIANVILDEMGGRFKIKFQTLRQKQGTKKGVVEYVEDFDIRVFDTTVGEEKSLEDLSGGERVWCDEAIARSCNIYKMHSFKLDNIFSDERDGALDSEGRKVEYMMMKRKILSLGGYKKEFMISHSPEVWNLADATINITKNGITMQIGNDEQDILVQDNEDIYIEGEQLGKKKKRTKKTDSVSEQNMTPSFF